MEEVARNECYHRNSKDFKDKNKTANCWEKMGQKFNLLGFMTNRRNKFACSKISSFTSNRVVCSSSYKRVYI